MLGRICFLQRAREVLIEIRVGDIIPDFRRVVHPDIIVDWDVVNWVWNIRLNDRAIQVRREEMLDARIR